MLQNFMDTKLYSQESSNFTKLGEVTPDVSENEDTDT